MMITFIKKARLEILIILLLILSAISVYNQMQLRKHFDEVMTLFANGEYPATVLQDKDGNKKTIPLWQLLFDSNKSSSSSPTPVTDTKFK